MGRSRACATAEESAVQTTMREAAVAPRTLAYDARGPGDPALLVPGGLTGWVSWIPHRAHLAATYGTIRVQRIHDELGSDGKGRRAELHGGHRTRGAARVWRPST